MDFKTFKKASELRKGDVIVAGKINDSIQSINYLKSKTNTVIKITGRTFNYNLSPNDKVEIYDVEKELSVLTPSDLAKIDRELMKSALRKQDNPFAICTDSVGNQDSAKYERCVQHVKAKYGKDWNAEHENMNTDLMSTSDQRMDTVRPDLTDDTTSADMMDTRRVVGKVIGSNAKDRMVNEAIILLMRGKSFGLSGKSKSNALQALKTVDEEGKYKSEYPQMVEFIVNQFKEANKSQLQKEVIQKISDAQIEADPVDAYISEGVGWGHIREVLEDAGWSESEIKSVERAIYD